VTRDELRAALLRILGTVAPEADLSSFRADRPLRDQLDIDSFDLLTMMVRIREALGVDVPDADYARLRTIDEAVTYLEARLAAPPR